MKIISIVIFIFISIQVLCQNSVDTAIVYLHRSNCSSNDTVEFFSLKKYKNGIFYASKNKLNVKVRDKFEGMEPELYVIFKCNHGKRKLEEGYWGLDGQDGYYKYYWPNGQPKSEGVYYGGQKIGKWIYYDQSGSKTNEEILEDCCDVLGTTARFPIL